MKVTVVRALPHSLAYSFVGIQTLILATNYPSIYWNCACLITNSGGNEDAEEVLEDLDENLCAREADESIIKVTREDIEIEDSDDDDDDEEVVKEKKKRLEQLIMAKSQRQ